MNPSPLQQALRFARGGLPVFPVIGKAPPPGTRGFLMAMTAPGMVKRQFSEHPTATGFGIRTGQRLRKGGYNVVVDVDPRHGGDTSLGAWEEEHGSLPVTFTVATGGEGLHLYFAAAEPLPCRAGFLPGVDLKGEGGYVVGPGSRHPSGGLYRIRENVPVAPLPPAFLDLVQVRVIELGVAPGAAVGAPVVDDVIPEGFRDVAMTSIAGTMRRRGLVAEEILPALVVINARRCSPPLPEHALVKIANSVGKMPAERPMFSTSPRPSR